MKFGFCQGYTIPMVLPFSGKMQEFICEEVGSVVDASPLFLKKYDPDYAIDFWMGAKSGLTEVEIKGPGIYRKNKMVEFAVNLPFDVILRADDGPRCALRFLFDGIRTILRRYEIDTTKLDANEARIIDKICSNPEMFDDDEPWPTLANYKPPKPPPPREEDPSLPAFKRIYKRIGGVLHHESVSAQDGIALHWAAKVGQKAKIKELPFAGSPKKAVETFLGVAVAKGFTELPEDHEIEIQYNVDDMGTPEDFDKLDALENQLHQLLGWLGLGVCNENSIGDGTMEVSCFVVDADIAMKCIKKALKGTRFGDYASIHVVEQDDEEEEDE